ncbi:MAG: hypothetical protein IT368_10685, partial [Candidatus Hydrogenedentes bacterium]|nr:hypothetical protein [Candidatus Hydrogenedentota bacterium]
MTRTLAALLLFASSATADGLAGTVTDSGGSPIGLSYVGLMTPSFEPVTYALTRPNGEFSLDQRVEGGLLVVQPPATVALQGVKSFASAPRIFRVAEEASLSLELPAVNSIVLCGYDASGALLRWRDYEKLGKLGGQFAYATNLRDEAQPATVWPVHGELTGQEDGDREAGLPAILVPPGQTYALRILFWPVPTCGKLMLIADNGGEGFAFESAGNGAVINLNVELARTAVQDLRRRQDRYAATFRTALTGLEARLDAALAKSSEAEKAKAADTVLAQALFLRDEAELDLAWRQIPENRMGTLQLKISGVAVPEECVVEVRQTRHEFLFGV